MSIATCPRCRNTGAVDERYCDCPAAIALRVRIDGDPRIAELRAKIERTIGDAQPTIMVRVDAATTVKHEFTDEAVRAVGEATGWEVKFS